jgi:large conductance mechanosensitive channel
MLKEFKEFAMKGNVMDLAIGVVIGAAFGKIIDSVVADLISPVIGMLTGGVNFSEKVLEVGQAKLMYGNFLNAIIQFIIVAFVLFLVVKAMNKMKKPEPPAAPAGPSDNDLLIEIRDLMKAKA